MSTAVLTEEEKKKAEEELNRKILEDFKALLLPVQNKLSNFVTFNWSKHEVRIYDKGISGCIAIVKCQNQRLEVMKDGGWPTNESTFSIADPNFDPEKFAIFLTDFIQFNWMTSMANNMNNVVTFIRSFKEKFNQLGNV